MTIFVYYKKGSCIFGDHDCGLEEFKTIVEADARVVELLNTFDRPDDEVRLIRIKEGDAMSF